MHFTLKVDSIIRDFYVCHSFIGPSWSRLSRFSCICV